MSSLSKISLAFKEWTEASCGCGGRYPHEVMVRRQKYSKHGGGLITYMEVAAKPDAQVCMRERKWREYCALRDGVQSRVG